MKQSNVITSGAFSYYVEKDWADKHHPSLNVHHCHEMVFNRKGQIILVNTEPKNNIVIFEPDGQIARSFTFGMKTAHGLTISEENGQEFIYVTDAEQGHRVIKADLSGNIVQELEAPIGWGTYQNLEQWKPTETAVAPNGDLYVADGYGEGYVTQYNAEGQILQVFGSKGVFDSPHGIAVDDRFEEPRLIVTSRGEQSFFVCNMFGEIKQKIHLPDCWICRPVIKGDLLYFAVIVTKDWFVYDGGLVVLDKENQVISAPGMNMEKSRLDKENFYIESDYKTFLNPHDVAVDDDGNIYVPQWLSGKTFPYKLHRISE